MDRHRDLNIVERNKVEPAKGLCAYCYHEHMKDKVLESSLGLHMTLINRKSASYQDFSSGALPYDVLLY